MSTKTQIPSKAQLRALKELAKGVTRFGPGMMCQYQTGKVLVDRGWAESLDDKEYMSSTYHKGYRSYLKARITPAGKEAIADALRGRLR